MRRKVITKFRRMEIIGNGLVEIERFKNTSKTSVLRNVNNFIDFDQFFEYSLRMLVNKLKETTQRISIKFNLYLDCVYMSEYSIMFKK